MNPLNYISDEEFLPFLQSLEVESDRKSFEWMFNDPKLSGVLKWLYNSLDQSNALSAREKYRYAEIEQYLLSPEDLEANIAALQDEFQGLCLPGDQETLQDVKMDVQMQRERLKLLERQETVIKDLIKQNDLTKEELSRDITKLNSAQHQLTQEEGAFAEECLTLANEVEALTESVLDVIADTLSLYSSAHADKETAKKFVAFGPFDSYRQAQALFRSHFDLFVARRLRDRRHDASDAELRRALVEADVTGERLLDAAYAYINAKTELAGEQAKLALVVNYQDVHPSRVAHMLMEEQAALDMEQEEPILEQQVQNALKELVEARTRLAVETTAKSALVVRERIHADLTHLLDTAHRALCLDRTLYYCLRAALRDAREFLLLSSHLKDYYLAEGTASADRIKSMNDICTEQESCEIRMQSSDDFTNALCIILGVKPSNDALMLVKLYNELQAEVRELKDNLYDDYEKREQDVVEFQKSTLPLRKCIWDGCTKLPNCWDTTVASMMHSVKQEMELVERKVAEASGIFSSVKNGDKQGLRKLWQWFLTDQNKLAAAMRAAQTS